MLISLPGPLFDELVSHVEFRSPWARLKDDSFGFGASAEVVRYQTTKRGLLSEGMETMSNPRFPLYAWVFLPSFRVDFRGQKDTSYGLVSRLRTSKAGDGWFFKSFSQAQSQNVYIS